MTKVRFSKDPKVYLQTLEEFFNMHEYFRGVTKKDFWNNKKPQPDGNYYKFTSNMFIYISYSTSFTNFGMDITEKLESIFVARRDGITEYLLFDKEIQCLKNERSKYKRRKKLDEKIEQTIRAKKLLPKFRKKNIPDAKPFESYLIDTGYKTNIAEFKNNYVVLDVETNGFRKANDDLLSISIYNPTGGKCYNRYLPLDLQPLILTGWIHGITDDILENSVHITQDELNKLIEFFDLKNKTILSFSGGQGTFDSIFIINYCKRHNLIGLEDLHYENIKSMFPKVGIGFEGQMSKDNLCRLLKIEGVKNIHSSMNDCILEWKLFERIKLEPLFFIKQHLFKYHEGYIVPVSYLNSYPELINFANITIPYVVGKAECIFEYSLPKKVMKEVKKFPTNITGISLENGINSSLNVEKQNNSEFLIKNKSRLEYIGSLDSRITEIPIEALKDGTMKSLDNQFDEYVEEVNAVTKLVINYLTPVFDFIKNRIFSTGKILSQELSISNDNKILALCDLSNEENVLEIKTFNISKENESISSNLARQLYYESKGRKTYVLSVDIDSHKNSKGKSITDAVNVRIYQILLQETQPKPVERIRTLYDDEIRILELIQENPAITNAEVARKIGRTPNSVGKTIKSLVFLKYLIKEDEKIRNSKWIVLRDLNDIQTKLSLYNGKVAIVL